MIDEFIRTLPLALCAAINPVGLLILVALLVTGEEKIKKTMSFIIGFFIAFFLLGIVLLEIFDHVLSELHLDSAGIVCDIDWAILLVVIVYFGYKIIINHHKKEVAEKSENKTSRTGNWFYYGVLYAVTDITSLIPYAILLKDVSGTKLNFFDKSFSILLSNIVVCIPLVILPLICIIFPNKSDAILGKIRSILVSHKKTISIVILIIIVVYLIFKISKCIV